MNNITLGDIGNKGRMANQFKGLEEGQNYIVILSNNQIVYISETLYKDFWEEALTVLNKEDIHHILIYTNCLDSRTHKWAEDIGIASYIYLYNSTRNCFTYKTNKVITNRVILSSSKQKEKINAEEFIHKQNILAKDTLEGIENRGKEVLKKLAMEGTLKEEERIMEGTTKENAYEDIVKPCIEDTLIERGNSYGEFVEHARITQAIKRAMRDSPNWEDLSDDKKEALEMDAHKTGRILNGDPELHDSWWDKSGYITLVANTLIEIKE